MDWIGQHWLVWLPLLLIAAGVLWLMPSAAARPKAVGLLLALAGIVLLALNVDDFTSLADDRARLGETALFWLFSAAAVLSAVLMITNRNPVYSALWFALVTLAVCGLFLLQFAPFLAAATVVVYAGAIVVTFVFVIMLAQQAGATKYDQRSRQPFVATVAAFVLLAAVVGVLRHASEQRGEDKAGSTTMTKSASETPPTETAGISSVEVAVAESGDGVANPLSHIPKDQPLGRVRALGRSLFGDYLFAVELAGTLLLVATIGAIAIAPRRQRGTL
jgi:NADH-quinone oxidoreductase subunit J